MMKVLYIITTYSENNGILTFVKNMLESDNFKNSGFELHVIGFDSYFNQDIYNEFKEYTKSLTIITNPTKSYNKFIKEIKKFYKENKFDIIHCNLTSLGYYHMKYAKKYNPDCKIIQHAHASSFSDSKLKSLIHEMLYKRSIKYTNYNLACSKKAGKFLFKNRKFDIIYNTIKVLGNDTSFNLFNREDNINYIGFVGRIEKQKNPLFLIDIAKKLNTFNYKYKFVIIGEGSLLNEFKEKVNREFLTNYFTFLGNVSKVPTHFYELDMIVMPSYFEGLPLVAIEAQEYKTKILISNNITGEVVISNYCKIIEDLDPYLWAQAIMNFKPETYLRNENYDNFNLDFASKHLLDIYKKII